MSLTLTRKSKNTIIKSDRKKKSKHPSSANKGEKEREEKRRKFGLTNNDFL